MKKFLITTSIIAGISSIALAIGINRYLNYTRYPSEQKQSRYQEGYNAGITNENEAKEMIAYYTTEINSLQSKYTTLSSSLEEKKAALTKLENQLQTSTKQEETLIANIEQIKQSIANSEKQLDIVADEILFYQQLIDSIQLVETSNVTFLDDDNTVLSITTTENNTLCTDIPSINSTTFKEFLGWRIEGSEDLTDISTYTITQNVTFVAVYQYRYTVTYIVDGNTYSSEIVDQNELPTPPTVSIEDITFKYWTLDGSTEIDLSTISITEDTTFIAKISHIYTYSFYDGDTLVTSVKVNSGGRLSSLPTAPTKEGYTFSHWETSNGPDGSRGINYIQSYHYASQDVDFYAVYTLNE